MAASSSSSSSSSSMAAFQSSPLSSPLHSPPMAASSSFLPSHPPSMAAFQSSPLSSALHPPPMTASSSSLPSHSPSMAAFHSSPLSSPLHSPPVAASSSFLPSHPPSVAAFHSSPLSSPLHSPPMAASSSSLPSHPPSVAAFHSSPLSSPLHPPPMAASSSSSTTAPPEKTLRIECANSQITEVSLTVALQSTKLNKWYELNNHNIDTNGAPIQVTDVTKPIFDKVMEFCEMELKAKDSSATLKEKEESSRFFLTFVQELQHLDTLYDVIEAANTLGIDSLLEQACQLVAEMMKGKTVTQIRQLFNIENDYTPEEEDAVRREFTWVFEK